MFAANKTHAYKETALTATQALGHWQMKDAVAMKPKEKIAGLSSLRPVWCCHLHIGLWHEQATR